FSRRSFLVGAAASAAGLALYAGEVARHEVDIVPRALAIDNLPSAFHGYRIVRHVNALSPDLVLLTGDFVTHGAFTFLEGTRAAYRCAEILSGLTAPL